MFGLNPFSAYNNNRKFLAEHGLVYTLKMHEDYAAHCLSKNLEERSLPYALDKLNHLLEIQHEDVPSSVPETKLQNDIDYWKRNAYCYADILSRIGNNAHEITLKEVNIDPNFGLAPCVIAKIRWLPHSNVA